MSPGRLRKYPNNDPGNQPDKGLADAKDAANPDRVMSASPGFDNGLKQFEDAGFASVQARIGRSHENTRTVVAGTGQANTAPQKESRGISQHSEVFSSARGRAPKRSKGKPTGSANSQAELQRKGLTR